MLKGKPVLRPAKGWDVGPELEGRKELSLEQLAKQLQHLGELTLNPYLLRFQVDGYIITAFKDGRAIIGGTDDIATAKKLYAQYLGA